MIEDDNTIFAFCWFDEEQWNLLAKVDPGGVDESYSQWRKNANKAFTELNEKGLKVQKLSIKISELLKWCQERNVEPNSKSRSEYAAFIARERDEKT